MVSSSVPNVHISEVIFTPISDMEVSSDDSRTELDSHTRIVVPGSNSFVFESTVRAFNVRPFSSDLGMEMNVPIADGDLSCDYPCTGKVRVLVIINELYIPSMHHNLIPPFIIRAGCFAINDFP